MENLVKFKRSLTAAQFAALASKDANTLYFISDESKLYLGARLIAEGNTITSVNNLTGDVTLSNLGISTADGTTYTVYDPVEGGTIVTDENIVVESIDDTHKSISIRTLPAFLLSGVDYSDYIVNKNYVDTAIAGGFAKADALTYKGVITVFKTNSPQSDMAYTPSANKGDVYKVAIANPEYPGANVINGIPVEHGDMLICNTDDTPEGSSTNDVSAYWDYIQRNEDGVVSGPASSAEGNIAIFDSTSGKVIADGGVSLSDITNDIATLQDALTWK